MKGEVMARYKQKEITVRNVPADVVSNRVYYEDDNPPNYNSNFAEFPSSKLTITMPDDIPAVMGKPLFFVGLTAINDQGHESDMGLHPDPFGYVAPPVPDFSITDV